MAARFGSGYINNQAQVYFLYRKPNHVVSRTMIAMTMTMTWLGPRFGDRHIGRSLTSGFRRFRPGTCALIGGL